MTDEAFVRQVVNDATRVVTIEEFPKKVESMIVLALGRKPTLVLGKDEYPGNKIEFINYDFPFYTALYNSSLFAQYMYRLGDRVKNKFSVCQLDKLRYVLEYMFYRPEADEELANMISSAEFKISEALKETEELLLLDIEEKPIEHLKNYPNSFFQHIPKMKASNYFDLVMNNDFIEAIDDLIYNNHDFSLEQIAAAQKILGTSIKLYGFVPPDEDEEYGDYDNLADFLIGYIGNKDMMAFNFDACYMTYEKLEGMFEKRKRKIKE